MTAGMCVVGAIFAAALGQGVIAIAFLVAAVFTSGDD